jgi:hypothetical protein
LALGWEEKKRSSRPSGAGFVCKMDEMDLVSLLNSVRDRTSEAVCPIDHGAPYMNTVHSLIYSLVDTEPCISKERMGTGL